MLFLCAETLGAAFFAAGLICCSCVTAGQISCRNEQKAIFRNITIVDKERFDLLQPYGPVDRTQSPVSTGDASQRVVPLLLRFEIALMRSFLFGSVRVIDPG